MHDSALPEDFRLNEQLLGVDVDAVNEVAVQEDPYIVVRGSERIATPTVAADGRVAEAPVEVAALPRGSARANVQCRDKGGGARDKRRKGR